MGSEECAATPQGCHNWKWHGDCPDVNRTLYLHQVFLQCNYCGERRKARVVAIEALDALAAERDALRARVKELKERSEQADTLILQAKDCVSQYRDMCLRFCEALSKCNIPAEAKARIEQLLRDVGPGR